MFSIPSLHEFLASNLFVSRSFSGDPAAFPMSFLDDGFLFFHLLHCDYQSSAQLVLGSVSIVDGIAKGSRVVAHFGIAAQYMLLVL